MAIDEVVDWEIVASDNVAHHPPGPRGRDAATTSTSFRELQAAIARWRDTVATLTQANRVIAGDPGTEGTGVTINGDLFEAALKVSDIGGVNEAQFILHRHSNTLPSLIVSSRARGETDSHTIVQDDDILLGIFASGWDGTDYALSSQILFEVDGTPGNNDMPGRIIFKTSPNSSHTPVEAVRIDSDRNTTLSGDLIATSRVTFDDNATVGNTRMLIYDVDNATLERVSVGAADSGGSGFKLLRIPN